MFGEKFGPGGRNRKQMVALQGQSVGRGVGVGSVLAEARVLNPISNLTGSSKDIMS